MKKLFVLLIFVLFSVSAFAASLRSYEGMWINADRNSRGIAKIVIYKQNGILRMHVYGKCHPRNCDWGVRRAYAYGRSVSSNINSATVAISSTFVTSFKVSNIIVRKIGNRLRVTVYTRFKDRSGRSNYVKTYLFEKTLLGEPLEAHLKAPVQIFPPNNKVFNHYPRRTLLRWKRVRGAVKYVVEVDCFHCCKSGKWCYDVNHKAWLKKVTNKTYLRFNFVGAQPGRWRVWAVDARGVSGYKSPWRVFRYTK